MPPEDRADGWSTVRSLGRPVRYPPGTVVTTQGDAVDTLHILESGFLALSVAVDDEERLIGFVERGMIVGGMDYFGRCPRSSTTRALTETHTLLVRREILEDLLASDAAAREALAHVVATGSRLFIERHVRYSQGSIAERVGRVLLDHLDDSGPSSDTGGAERVLSTPLRQKHVADLVGAGPRAVGLELARFSAAGLVDTGYRARPRRLRVLRPAALSRLVDHDDS
ncbi:hypothetical protein GCM10009836_00290 [Pseudonocardia ailaonensis]|uniref:Cyclic nucleotide-binding domain-containing protein n=1 Tax=Pseudonocardia ailaonensis TaxID=367279 RepID=A0ABN2MGL4_9PSEU